MPSGVVFVAIVVIWAMILAPRAVRLYERTATQRTTKRFNSAMSVLGSGTSVARVVVDTARRGSRMVVDPRTPALSVAGADATTDRDPGLAPVRELSDGVRRRRRAVAACAGLVAVAIVGALVGRLPWLGVALAMLPLVAFLGACAVFAPRRRRRLTALARVNSAQVSDSTVGGAVASASTGSSPSADSVADAVPAAEVVLLSTRRVRRSGLRAGSWTQARVLEADLAIAATYASTEEQLGMDRYVASPSAVDGEPYLRAANE